MREHTRHLAGIKRAYETPDKKHDWARRGPIGTIENETSRIKAHIAREWVDQRCKQRIYPNVTLVPDSKYSAPDLATYEKWLTQGKINQNDVHRELFELVDRQLEQGRVVSIGWDVNNLYKRPGSSPGEGDHASIVAARKEIGGVCHYHLRIHWGPGCGYHQQVQKGCEPDGGIWLPAKSIPSIYAVLWLTTKR